MRPLQVWMTITNQTLRGDWCIGRNMMEMVHYPYIQRMSFILSCVGEKAVDISHCSRVREIGSLPLPLQLHSHPKQTLCSMRMELFGFPKFQRDSTLIRWERESWVDVDLVEAQRMDVIGKNLGRMELERSHAMRHKDYSGPAISAVSDILLCSVTSDLLSQHCTDFYFVLFNGLVT